MKVLQREGLVYTNKIENSNKFYIISLIEDKNDYYIICRYGRLGQIPQIRKFFDANFTASNHTYNKKIYSLLQKGYKKTSIDEIMANCGEFF